ncbi:MAG TPA: hypothetical protein PKA06_16290 [Gemmatales bacterium]|nr:hypothetical protein [Gemmatales bacterium]HMP15546.1 hypothetical protein [Gemmatales bacterium]
MLPYPLMMLVAYFASWHRAAAWLVFAMSLVMVVAGNYWNYEGLFVQKDAQDGLIPVTVAYLQMVLVGCTVRRLCGATCSPRGVFELAGESCTRVTAAG